MARTPSRAVLPHRGTVCLACLGLAIAGLWVHARAEALRTGAYAVPAEAGACRAALAKGHQPDAMWAGRR